MRVIEPIRKWTLAPWSAGRIGERFGHDLKTVFEQDKAGAGRLEQADLMPRLFQERSKFERLFDMFVSGWLASHPVKAFGKEPAGSACGSPGSSSPPGGCGICHNHRIKRRMPGLRARIHVPQTIAKPYGPQHRFLAARLPGESEARGDMARAQAAPGNGARSIARRA